MPHKYDNEVAPDNKYGHTLELLAHQLGAPEPGAVHLDLACGMGHMAEHVVERFGLTYIGADVDKVLLEDLDERGFETHVLDTNAPGLADKVRAILDGRPLASVSFLDALEHMTEGWHALEGIGDILAENRAIAVTSVPNVSHLDVALKLLLGHWSYTEAGLLDVTHYQLYTQDSLTEAFARAGLRPVETNDVVLATSDQHFPADFALLSERSSLSHFLRSVRERAEPNGLVNQFVWALAPAPRQVTSALPGTAQIALADHAEPAPFLSVIIRTQGRRQQELREALLTLAGQTNDDFEVLVVAHRTSIEQQKVIERVIADQRPDFQERIRLLKLDRGGRSAPLNLGLTEARGHYVSIFDDDDIVLADWVDAFAKGAESASGTILRGIALRQNVTLTQVIGADAVRATTSPRPVYEREFALYRHVFDNQSPPIGWVFPRSLTRDFGLYFDESMTTVEDWDFLLKAARLVGVTDVDQVTAIYRWWTDRDSSRTAHPPEEWRQNQDAVRRHVDSVPFLLPAGETRRLREDLRRLKQLERNNKRLREELKEQRESSEGRLRRRLKGRTPRSVARAVLRKSRTAARNPELFRLKFEQAVDRARYRAR